MIKNLLLLTFSFILLTGLLMAQRDKVRCVTHEYMEQLQAENPRLGDLLTTNEDRIQQFISQNPDMLSAETVVTIPVVVHVIWNTASQNISDAMIQSQIRVFNEDFRRILGTPGWNNNPVGADTKIEFRLADRDPNGNPHSGINRVQTAVTSWNYQTQNAQLKALSYWNSANFLNLWVANLSGGILGYAQFPGGAPATDGVVILWSAFGYNSPAVPYNLGRTATHEVGHWLNLYHTWGDVTNCSGTDLCNDTPPCSNQYFSSYPSCPNPVQCSGMERMIENYMDYSDDGCMNIYTVDQTSRMKASYQTSRTQLWVSLKEKIAVSSTGVDYNFTNLQGQTFATLNFSSLGTTDSVTVEVFPNLLPPNMPVGSKAVRRYFNVTPNGTGYNATLTVNYNDPEVVGFVNGDANLKLFKYTGGNWVYMGGTGNPTANTVTLSGVTSFSMWALSDPTDNPLPVELSTFTANVNESNVTLNWSTASEQNSHGFEIERALITLDFSNTTWEEIAFVPSHGTTTETKYYSYTDTKLNPGNYNYRLKMIDQDGSYDYSAVVNAQIETPAEYTLYQNYPNPFNPATVISYQLPTKGHVSLKVYDALGVEVASLLDEVKDAGSYDVNFDASNLTSGVYFYTLISNNFMQTNKMILVK
ncbi:MAG: T9SS type A sorting domain-containing protein [Ignavibacteriales bacterium]|nr:MAG: T9SS type A sorting domain-containing protein [Ignavibacteriales bacterium]